MKYIFASVLLNYCLCSLVSGTCPPLRLKKGVVVDCEIPDSKSVVDCLSDVSSGTEAFYQCQKNYMNDDGNQFGGKLTCSPQGRWLKLSEYQDFYCMPECGRSRNSSLTTLSSFIEREFETGDEIFPWHVAIFRRYGDTSLFKYNCGGTLVNPYNKGFIVLTAAHCVTKSASSIEPASENIFRVVLGPISTEFSGNIEGHSQIMKVKRIVTEREYDPQSLQSDIAMIELDGPIKISDTVQPACFPTRKIANAQVRPNYQGEIPIIKNDQLNFQEILRIPVADQGDCIKDCEREPTITEFCAKNTAGGSLTSYDSGSGLVFNVLIDRPQRYFLQGILTRVGGISESCASHDTFTSVSVFLDWVSRVHEQIADGQRIKEVILAPPPPSRTPVNTLDVITRPLSTTPTTTQVPSIFQVGQEFSRIGLERHNFYRKRHQVPLLQLNGKLSKEAQDWADYLLRENKWEFSEGKDYSENIFQFFGKTSEPEVIRKAVENWYEAVNKYDWTSPEASTFSQLVWKGTTHIGIGIATKGAKSVVVTNYWPKGNIYNIGEGDRARYFRENVLPTASDRDDFRTI